MILGWLTERRHVWCGWQKDPNAVLQSYGHLERDRTEGTWGENWLPADPAVECPEVTPGPGTSLAGGLWRLAWSNRVIFMRFAVRHCLW